MFKVLIAEDEYLLRTELAMTIDWERMDCVVSAAAEDGAQALEMALADPPDIVLTDIRMPRMDGLALIERLRERINAVYIILSGYDSFTYAVRALQFGVMDYILKPLDEERLCACVTSAVERLREARAAEAAPPAALPGDAGNLYVRRAIEYLNEHYMEDVRVADVAAALYISESYLSRLFIRTCKMRFTEYLNRLRIMRSLPLLRDPQFKIYEAALHAGYKDQQYYCVVFKKVMGVSPQQFRHSALPARTPGRAANRKERPT